MGLKINTNMTAISAQRNLKIAQSGLQAEATKLASGSRINQSADDAAGLAISENITGQLRSFAQANRNAQDGISYIQVAEGGMKEASNMVIRLRELSMQAASDTIGDTERAYLDREAQQLKTEIQRVAQSTVFNGTPLLNGTGGILDFQIGSKNNEFLDRISYSAGETDVTLDTLGLGGIDIMSKDGARGGLDSLDTALTVINGNRAKLGALQNRLESTIRTLDISNENLSAARSRIADTDMGMMSSELARDQVKTQAATSILSSSNTQTALALKLIG